MVHFTSVQVKKAAMYLCLRISYILNKFVLLWNHHLNPFTNNNQCEMNKEHIKKTHKIISNPALWYTCTYKIFWWMGYRHMCIFFYVTSFLPLNTKDIRIKLFHAGSSNYVMKPPSCYDRLIVYDLKGFSLKKVRKIRVSKGFISIK